MSNKKIVCLGGGSLYFARVLADLAMASGLAGSEITLYDLDREKSEIMAATGRRLAAEAGINSVGAHDQRFCGETRHWLLRFLGVMIRIIAIGRKRLVCLTVQNLDASALGVS